MLQNSGPKRPGKLAPTILMTLIGALRTTQGRNWDERHGSGSVEIFLRNFILLRWESSLQKWNFYHTPLPTTRHNTVVSYSSTISNTYVVRWRCNVRTKKVCRETLSLLIFSSKFCFRMSWDSCNFSSWGERGFPPTGQGQSLSRSSHASFWIVENLFFQVGCSRKQWQTSAKPYKQQEMREYIW